MKLCVIGDIHLFSLEVHPRRLVSKRVFAHANLLLNRRHRFNHALLPGLVERVRGLSPGLVLFSGDVSTSSLEREFEDLLKVVGPLSAEVGCVLVPGNHDRYTFGSRRARRIETLLHEVMPASFPHVRELGPGWTLLALDSAIPNRVFSRGALGRAQYDAAVAVIRNVPADEALVVLCHYPCSLPPRVPSAWSHDMKEAAGLRRELSACRGRVVYVHGHIHKPWHATPPGTPPGSQGNNSAPESLPGSQGSNSVPALGNQGGNSAPAAGSQGRHSVPGSSLGSQGGNSGLSSSSGGASGGGGRELRPAFECINAGSPCMTSEKYPLGQGFWELNLPADPHAPLDAIHHIPTPAPTPGSPSGSLPGSPSENPPGSRDGATPVGSSGLASSVSGVCWIAQSSL